jgi:hypothetical protein
VGELERGFLVVPGIARSAAPGAGGVAALDDEIADNAMEGHPIIKAIPRQEHEVVYGFGRFVCEEFDVELALGGLEMSGVGLAWVDLHFWGTVVLLCQR